MIRLWRAAGWLAILVVGICAASATTATNVAAEEARKVFEVHRVKVDVTAATAAAAKDLALAEAEVRAFEALFDRLAPARQRASLGKVPPAQIQAATRSFWVTEEKVSPVRYLATLNYAFRADRVRAIARERGVPLITQVSPRVLVVPVYERGDGQRLLWEEDNPWRRAWASLSADGLVPVLVPASDSAGTGLMDANQAVAGDGTQLGALAGRLGVFEALVAVANPKGAPAAGTLEVTIKRKPSFAVQQDTILTVRRQTGESDDEHFARAALVTLNALEDEWKVANLVQEGGSTIAAVDVAVSDLAGWLAVRPRLEKLPTVERVDELLFARNRVRVNIYHTGTPAELSARLERAGFSIVSSGSVWLVRPVQGQGQRTVPGRS
jgi:hypothetical protein